MDEEMSFREIKETVQGHTSISSKAGTLLFTCIVESCPRSWRKRKGVDFQDSEIQSKCQKLLHSLGAHSLSGY